MKLRKYLCLLGLCTSFLQAQNQLINNNWNFRKSEQNDINQITHSESWEVVNLPHTWNAFDGQDGGKGYHDAPVYYRGTGWYTKNLTFYKNDIKKQIYLRFGAANYDTEVFLNGKSVGKHIGGYTAFAFDLTPYIQFGRTNQLAVRVNNAEGLPVPPLHADFTFFGGLTRNVELIKDNKVHITNEDFGSRGVFVKQEKVSESEATIAVTTEVRNCERKEKEVTVKVFVKDRTGNLVEENVHRQKVASGETVPVTQTFRIKNPRLWNGKKDPYLYRTEVEVYVGKKLTDKEVQPLGLRYYRIDPEKGFFLNGHPYPLRGVCMHEQRMDHGNALSDIQRKEDLDMVNEMGANYMRISHYQHGDFTYNYLDSLGIICWTEIPLIDKIQDTEEFKTNSENLMKSLIRQLYNHPSIAFWGLCNEINFHKGPDPLSLVEYINKVAHREDSTRPTVLAAMHHEKPSNFVPDAFSINPYYGWYYGKPEDIGKALDRLHGKYPQSCLGISEYGAGAHPFQQQEDLHVPATTGQWHPENVQTNFHEVHLRAINERPYLWSTSVWAMFDFASDGRHEGNQPGINDKGLVTHDRKIKKDAYYFYKANWNPEPMVHLCSKRFIKRNTQETIIKAYSNCDKVSLTVNEKEVSIEKKENAIYLSEPVTLKEGTNKICVIALKDGKEYKDNAVWYYVPINK